MAKLKTLIILAVLTGAAVFAVVQTGEDTNAGAQTGEPLFPDLLERINDITTIEATSGEGSLTIKLDGERWVVAERFNHPAEINEVRGVLVGAGELKRVEAKTSKVEQYAKLEVSDPATGGESIGYIMRDDTGAAVAEIIVGKRRLITSSNDIDEYYVRVPSEERAWLVEGKIPKHRVVTDWLAREVFRIPAERIHRTTVTHADGTTVRAVKAKPGMPNFTLLDIPEGKKVDNDYDVHSFAAALTDSTLSDVQKPDSVDFDDPEYRIRVETFDGLVVTIEPGKKDKDVYLRLSAHTDASTPTLLGVKPGKIAEGLKGELKDFDGIKAEAAALNQRWASWVYRVPTFNLDNARKKVGDIVVDVQPEKAASQ